MKLRRLISLTMTLWCSSWSTQLLARDLPDSYQLRYWQDFEQHFETEAYLVSLTLSDGNEIPDHTVAITAKDTAFQTKVSLGLQGGETPVIDDITQMSLCDLDLLIIDFRWPLGGEILVNHYERLLVDRTTGALAATLDDVMSSKINGWFPAENIKLFYEIVCDQELQLTPRPHEAFEGGGVIIKDRPGH